MDKYLSIITNFGCHYTCPYCIVKNNHLEIPKSTVAGLDRLSEEIERNKCNWVSVSGGGDPLFQVEHHGDWFTRFFQICHKMGVKTELHTSLNLAGKDELWKGKEWDRIVYHCIAYPQLFSIERRSSEIVRVVFVVTELFTPALIDKIVKEVKNNPNIDELSFRQMVDDHYQETDYCQEYLRAGHKKDWWYIEQNDYNLYYAENQVSTRYRDFEAKEKIAG